MTQKNNFSPLHIQDKNALRAHMLARRKKQPSELIAQDSVRMEKNLLATELWQKACSVALYMALPDEAQTDLLLQSAWSAGKNVYLPLCRKNARGEMDFIRCTGYDDLARGAYGLQEPTPKAAQGKDAVWHVGQTQVDILLVPGLVFDSAGYRIGFGGGYYDRFLSALHNMQGQKTCCLGAAFSWQIVENVSYEAWDMPVHGLVSEEGLRWI